MTIPRSVIGGYLLAPFTRPKAREFSPVAERAALRKRKGNGMKSQVLMALLVTGFVMVGVSGCCCVNSCGSSCDFAGVDCTATCGSCGGGSCRGGGCGGAGCAGGTVVGSYAPPGSCGGELGGYAGHGLGSGCLGWNSPQFFVDECGNPCFGPIAGLAHMVRGAFMNASCGCGGYYVDEWISDPPLCQDPCCDDCGSCGGACGGDTCSGGCGGTCATQSAAKRHLAARRGIRTSPAHYSGMAGTRRPTSRVAETNAWLWSGHHSQAGATEPAHRPATKRVRRVNHEEVEAESADETPRFRLSNAGWFH